MTSPSISSASSNWVIEAVVPLSALSIRSALNVPTPHSRCLLGRSGDCPLHRLLDDRQVDQRRSDTEEDREIPHRRIGAGLLEHHAAEIDPEKATYLMAEKREAVKRRK